LLKDGEETVVVGHREALGVVFATVAGRDFMKILQYRVS
jgi:hypothetical protein